MLRAALRHYYFNTINEHFQERSIIQPSFASKGAYVVLFSHISLRQLYKDPGIRFFVHLST